MQPISQCSLGPFVTMHQPDRARRLLYTGGELNQAFLVRVGEEARKAMDLGVDGAAFAE